GQRHVQLGHVVLDPHAVDQAEIDHVDAELGVDDIAHRLLEVLEQLLLLGRGLGLRAGLGRRLIGRRRLTHGRSPFPLARFGAALSFALPLSSVSAASVPAASSVSAVASSSATIRTTASLKAIQPSRAHFTRAGYLETPDSAMPSPSNSSSPSMVPRLEIISLKASTVFNACCTGRPMT